MKRVFVKGGRKGTVVEVTSTFTDSKGVKHIVLSNPETGHDVCRVTKEEFEEYLEPVDKNLKNAQKILMELCNPERLIDPPIWPCVDEKMDCPFYPCKYVG